MREIDVALITKTVRDLFLDAVCHLGQDVVSLLKKGYETEESPFGKEILRQLLENARIAHETNSPLCQDTGMAVLFVEVGQDVHFINGDINTAIEEGVRQAYRQGHFRASVLDPLTRINTGDNTPPIVHYSLIPGEHVRITVAPKGFGSENMSALRCFSPSVGEEGVKNFIVETVKNAGANPCPPVVVGVGLGGTAEKAMLLAKHSLTREAGMPSNDPQLAAIEEELLARINALGIGPAGLGGRITALAVHIERTPTHIASLPVAVNMQCHAARHKTCLL